MTVRGGSVPLPASFEPPSDPRPRRATAVGRGTHAVSDVRRLIDSHFHIAFPHRIWVSGQVGRVEQDQEALRFTLRSSSGDEPFPLPCTLAAPTMPAVREQLDRLHDADVEDVVAAGRLARVGGLLRYDFDRGTATLQVSDLDPAATGLGLAEQRRVALDLVRAEALAERQRMNVCPTAPVHVALVGARDDAGLADAARRLTGAGYDVRLQVATVPVHGAAAAETVARAVSEQALRNDVVLLVRGPGRPLGLGVYDAEPVVRAVADAPVPVLTGLAAPEPTACDAVAFAALPSADAAAQWVLARLRAAEQSLRVLRDQVRADTQAAGARARESLEQARRQVLSAADEADRRATAAHRRRQLQLWVAAAVVAAAAVAGAVLTRAWGLLAGLVLVAGVLLADRARLASRARAGRAPTTASPGGDVQDDDFAQVLDRLHRVREELAATSSPEKVHRLRDTAEQLLDRGEQILGRHLDDRATDGRADRGAAAPAATPVPPAGPAPAAAPPAPGPTLAVPPGSAAAPGQAPLPSPPAAPLPAAAPAPEPTSEPADTQLMPVVDGRGRAAP